MLVLLVLLPTSSFAHALDVATLRIHPDANGILVEARFHDAALARSTVLLQPEFCSSDAVGAGVNLADGSRLQTWRVRCRDRLPTGTELRLSGPLTGVFIDLGGAPSFRRASHGLVRVPIEAIALGRVQIVGQYFRLGVEHILGGHDHLLFLVGLLLIVGRGRELVLVISAFTVAHSITLTCAVLGWARLPQAPVEALIALSVALVARDAVLTSGAAGSAGTTRPAWRYAFVFGLFHGVGFAGALADVGFPAGHVPVALVSFNVGVELGQLAVVACAIACAAVAAKLRWNWMTRMRPALASGIGIMASFWLVERLDSMI